MSKNTNLGLTVAAIVFFVIGFVHLVRFINHFSVMIAGVEIPIIASLIGSPLFLFLAFWLWSLRTKAE